MKKYTVKHLTTSALLSLPALVVGYALLRLPFRLLDWLAERETFYPVEIHTANPVGRANMERILARYWGEQYW